MEGCPLRKMSVHARLPLQASGAHKVGYHMPWGDGMRSLDDLPGSWLGVRFLGLRTCMACGARVRKFYGQGLCYNCLRAAPQASPCIIRPELCAAHLGMGRDLDWERTHHLQEHVVYLAISGGLKVGVTRAAQVPARWLDQGAEMAVVVARMPYRQLAGAMEVELKKHFSDRTDWRRMLLGPQAPLHAEQLLAERGRLPGLLPDHLAQYLLPHEEVQQFEYPLVNVPPKLVGVQLDKLPVFEGKLQGIKGQYLVWSDGRVLNVRNHVGYHVEWYGTEGAWCSGQ